MSQLIEEKNKALVLEAFETLFNRRDYATAERYWSPNYIQHSAHIPPGREGLFNLVKHSPVTMKYENGSILAEGNLLMLHGRLSDVGPACELDCSGHRSHRGRGSGRALGCDPGRGDERVVKERPADVRRHISQDKMRKE